MKKGRLLIGLAITILFFMALTAPNLLSQANRGVAVPVDRLPERLKGLDIKDYFVKSNFKRVGVIHALTGTVIVVHKADRSAYFGKAGDYIYENDSLETLSDSKCRLKLINDDVVSMSVNSNLDVDEVALDRRKQEKRSFFSMLKGKAMFYSLRLFSLRKNNMSLKTPTAVVGVRGTKFGVDIYKLHERRAESGRILLADAGNSIPRLASNGVVYDGLRVYSFDSPVFIGDLTIGPNRVWDNEIIRDPYPGELEGFDATANWEGGVIATSTVAMVAPTTVITSTPVPPVVLPPQPPPIEVPTGAAYPSRHHGYYYALLHAHDKYPSPELEEVYVSRRTGGSYNGSWIHGDFDVTPDTCGYVRAWGLDIPTDYLDGVGSYSYVQNTDGSWTYTYSSVFQDPHLEFVKADGATATPDSDIVWHEVFHNSFVQLGTWSVPDAFSIGTSTFSVRSGGYAFGDNTPCENFTSNFTGTAKYTGPAWGTYWDASGDINMTGGVSCDVDFDYNEIDYFDLVVHSGTGGSADFRSAAIAGGSGFFNSSDPRSHFSITGGTWTLVNGTNTYTPTGTACSGAFYGPNADNIAGAGGMYYEYEGTLEGAGFIFQGNK